MSLPETASLSNTGGNKGAKLQRSPVHETWRNQKLSEVFWFFTSNRSRNCWRWSGEGEIWTDTFNDGTTCTILIQLSYIQKRKIKLTSGTCLSTYISDRQNHMQLELAEKSHNRRSQPHTWHETNQTRVNRSHEGSHPITPHSCKLKYLNTFRHSHRSILQTCISGVRFIVYYAVEGKCARLPRMEPQRP